MIISRSASLSSRLEGDPDLLWQWKVQDTGNGWTLQNVHNKKYLDVEGDLKNGASVVATETNNPRTWDIRNEQGDSSHCR